MYKKILEEMLPEARRKHSYCVADQAKKLAKIYGVNKKKAETAGLLHDITKMLSVDKQLDIIKESGLELDSIQLSNKLLHSISGSIYVSKYLDIKDEEIISAIRYHTTAKPKMTILEKIIYLADFTSADRKFSDVDQMREIVIRSLDEGMRYGLTYTIKELVIKQSQVHPDTFFAYNYYIGNDIYEE